MAETPSTYRSKRDFEKVRRPNTLRSLIAGVHRDGRLVHVGRIGTGYPVAKVAAVLPRLQAVESRTSPFEGRDAPKGGSQHPLGAPGSGGRDGPGGGARRHRTVRRA